MATPISQFRNRVSRHVPGCPYPLIDRVVREAAIRFCEDTHILSKAFEIRDCLYTSINSGDNDSMTFNIYEWDDSGSVTVDDNTGAVSFDPNYASYDPLVLSELELNQEPQSIRYMEFQNDRAEELNTGGYKYFNFPTQYTIKIFPLDEWANAAENFDTFMRIVVKPTLDATVVEDVLYDNHRKAIVAYALHILYDMPDRSWGNPQKSIMELANYNHEMGRARIKIQQGYTDAGSVISGGYF